MVHLQRDGDTKGHTSKPFLLSKVGTVSLTFSPKDEEVWSQGSVICRFESLAFHSLFQLPVLTVKVSPDVSSSFVLVTLTRYTKDTAAYRVENFSKKLSIKLRQKFVT